jgi:hypothetical protein
LATRFSTGGIKVGSTRNPDFPGNVERNALKGASVSGKRLNALIDKLSEISGMPKCLPPDKRIQESLYRRGEEGGFEVFP